MPTPPCPQRSVEFDFDFDKFLAAVHYLAAKKVPQLDKYKACKLLFLADKNHLVRYGRPIIGDRYCPLKYGPVPSHSLDLLNAFITSWDEQVINDHLLMRMRHVLGLDKRFQHPRLFAKVEMDSAEKEVLSKSDLDALEHVVKTFGEKGFYELKSLTHSVYAYKRAAEDIADMKYEDFFEEDADAVEGSLQEMLENFELRRAFTKK